MGRTRTTNPDEKKTERQTLVTWKSKAEKEEYQAHAELTNESLAGWLKRLAAESRNAGR